MSNIFYQPKRLFDSGEPECHPPPPLPPLTSQFSGLANVMQCDFFLYLVALVLERADNLKSKCFSENQVKALTLGRLKKAQPFWVFSGSQSTFSCWIMPSGRGETIQRDCI